MTDLSPPDGFTDMTRRSPMTDPWQPLYWREFEDRVQLGLWLAAPHTNARGLVHGGLIAALADNAMGYTIKRQFEVAGRETAGLVTVSLSVDFLGRASLGQWLEFDTDFVKPGGTICFARQIVRADAAPIARASATFKIVKAEG